MTAPVEVHRSIWGRLYHGETNIQFVTRLRRWLVVSGVVIVAGLVSLFFRGLNLGIDFEGGVVWEVPAGDLSVADAQSAMEGEGLQGLTVQSLTAEGETRLRIEAEPLESAQDAEVVSEKLAELTGSDVNDVSLNSVGPSWGEEISRKALRALIFFLIAITIYISLRFEFKMAVPTLAALIHDILITIGVYSIAGFEVTPATVIALLTILGFSIYDGIVVFDKVDENTKLVGTTHNLTYGGMVNMSLNQVLMRSLNTSITALLPVASLFAGAYSSIFIASPLLAVLKEREPRYRELKARMAGRQASVPSAPVAAGEEGVTAGAPRPRRSEAPAPALSGRAIPPRPRKKSKKR
jgi:preprotein translocase subunit SecF